MWPVTVVLLGACDPMVVPGDAGACGVGATRGCGMFLGECEPGTERCVDGAWSGVCEGAVGPVAETCNMRDDDCDGMIDGPAAAASCPAEPFATAYECAGFRTCRVTECAPDHGYCTAGPGCQTLITMDRDHCGGCLMRCDVDRTCEDSICVPLPETNWLWSGGGPAQEGASDIVSNGSGGAYLTGGYGGAGEIGMTMFTPRFEGGFVTELDAEGRGLWEMQASLRGLTIAGSTTEAVWVYSSFRNSATIGAHTVTSDPVMSNQVVAARVRSGGIVDWTWVSTNTGSFQVYDSALLADDTLILAGLTTGTVDFASTRVSADEASATVVAIDSSGAVAWVSTLVAPGFDVVRAIVALDSGELLVGIAPEAAGTMRGVAVMPATSGGSVLVRLVDGVPTQQLPYDGFLMDVAVGEGATYMVVQCTAAAPAWPGRDPCSTARPDRLVALDAAWEVQYHVALPYIGYRITTIDDQVVGALWEGSMIRLFDASATGALRQWERAFSTFGVMRFDGRNLYVASTFTASFAVEGRVLSSAGLTDAMAWSARIR